MRIPALASLTAFVLLSSAAMAADGSGWYLARASDSFAIGTGATLGMAGKQAVYIRGSGDSIRVGSLQQDIAPDAWRGKRVRVTLRYKQDVTKAHATADIWAQVGKPNGSVIRGGILRASNSDWHVHQVVLDVPENADSMAFGIDLHGNGTGWVDSVALEAVGTDVPVSWSKEYSRIAAIGDRRGYVGHAYSAPYYASSWPQYSSAKSP